MSDAFIALLIVFVVLAAIRVPLAFAMFGAGVVYLVLKKQDIGLVAEQSLNSLYNSYVLLAVPMFILAANVMNAGTISERLWGAAQVLVGKRRGGLAQVTVVVSAIFSSMSGSAIADAAGPGMVAIRMMRDVAKYPPGYAVAVTAAAATIAPIIPPSIPMVIYALFANVSVSALFLGGVIPGLLMAVVLMLAVSFTARRAGLPVAEALPRAERRRAINRSLVPLTLPIVLLGGIWTGAFTPTEAAAVAGCYALLLSAFVYRTLGWKGVVAVLLESLRASTVVMILIAGAFIINYAVTAEQLDKVLASWATGQQLSPVAFLLTVNVIFLVLGCILDTGILLFVLVPVLLPTVKLLGIDPVFFGVVMIVNLMIGLITPPYGMLLFVLSALTKTALGPIVKAVWPFLGALVFALFLMIVFPEIVLFLPKLAGYGKT